MRRISVGYGPCLGCTGTEGPAAPRRARPWRELRGSTAHGRHPVEVQCDALSERKRIGPGQDALQGGHLCNLDVRTGPDPLERGPRLIIAPQQAGAAPLFALQFHRGLEEILEEPELRIQGVERPLGLHRVVAIPAHELADMRPVLLFHMGVVILLL